MINRIELRRADEKTRRGIAALQGEGGAALQGRASQYPTQVLLKDYPT